MFTDLGKRTIRNGLLIDDAVNRDYLLISPQEKTVDMVGDVELHERRRFDPESSWHLSIWSFYMKMGQDLELKAR